MFDGFESFGLDGRLLRACADAGFAEPFPIQRRAIAPLLDGRDVIGQAKTGTGKTAAYALPMLQRLDAEEDGVQALVLAPTRELAIQITEEIRRLGKYMHVRAATLYGGQPIKGQIDRLRRGVHVVVGTPGRVIDHIRRGTLTLSRVSFVVIDEADTMLEMGFIDDVEYILRHTRERKQVAIFSATIPQNIITLSRKYMHSPEKILIDWSEPSVEKLRQYYLVHSGGDRLKTLLGVLELERGARCMVFCNTKVGVRRLSEKLRRLKLDAVAIHGDLSQRERLRAIGRFRDGRARILVATDVAGRGLDIPSVDCVINYEPPRNPLLYFHRVGRTARAGKAGRSYTIITPEEKREFGRIRQLTQAEIQRIRVEKR